MILQKTLYIWFLLELLMHLQGTKGISLFLVPKIQVKEDGSLGSKKWRFNKFN